MRKQMPHNNKPDSFHIGIGKWRPATATKPFGIFRIDKALEIGKTHDKK